MKTYTEYLLDCLAEEAAEIIQAVTKAHRFGLDDLYPKRGTSNREQLALEVDDFAAVVELLRDRGVIPAQSETAIEQKRIKIAKWLAYSQGKGLVEI